jgi:hypothetical protein
MKECEKWTLRIVFVMVLLENKPFISFTVISFYLLLLYS